MARTASRAPKIGYIAQSAGHDGRTTGTGLWEYAMNHVAAICKRRCLLGIYNLYSDGALGFGFHSVDSTYNSYQRSLISNMPALPSKMRLLHVNKTCGVRRFTFDHSEQPFRPITTIRIQAA